MLHKNILVYIFTNKTQTYFYATNVVTLLHKIEHDLYATTVVTLLHTRTLLCDKVTAFVAKEVGLCLVRKDVVKYTFMRQLLLLCHIKVNLIFM